MSEETVVAESVTSTDAPAIDPALLNPPVRPESQSSAGSDDLLKHKLGLANQHAKDAQAAKEAQAEREQLKKELEELKALQTSQAQKSLEDQGQFKYGLRRKPSLSVMQRLFSSRQSLLP